MTVIFQGHTTTEANADLDAIVASVVAEVLARTGATAQVAAQSGGQWGPTKAVGSFSGRNFSVSGGTAIVAGAAVQVSGSSVVVADNTVSYVERTYAGVVSANQTGFTSGLIAIARVTAAGGVITAVEDWRPMFGPFPYYALVAGETGVLDLRYPLGDIRRYGASPAASSTVNAAAIQACITSTPAGSATYTPTGDYAITGAGAQILLQSKALVHRGDSFTGSRWIVDYNVANTVDVLRIAGANFDAVRLERLSIIAQAAPFVAGTGTVAVAAGGIATFSTSQAGVVTRGGQVQVSGVSYLVLSFNGTTGAVLNTGATTFAASAFTYSRVPARYGVNFDVTPGYIANVVLDHVKVAGFSDDSVRCTNPVPAIDGLFLMSIRDSVINGGIGLIKAGDNVSIERTNIGGVGGLIVDLVPGTDGGAHGFSLTGGNITCAGNIEIRNASACYLNPNNMEAPFKSTSLNGALIDLAGSAGSPLENVIVDAGYLGGTTGNLDCCIRFDYVVKPHVRSNLTVPPGILTDATPRCAWRATLHAVGVVIDDPFVSPFGILLSSVLDDQGTGTDVPYWLSPGGTNPIYHGHPAQKSNERIVPAGYAQTAGSVIWAIIAAATTVANRATQGFLRVFGNGNVRVGDGADNGFPLQVKGSSSFDGTLALEAARTLSGRDSAAALIAFASMSAADNFTRFGSATAPATPGGTIVQYAGVQGMRQNSTGIAFYTAAPVARAAAITAPTAPSAGYVQAEAQSMKTAVDAIRTALANIGITL